MPSCPHISKSFGSWNVVGSCFVRVGFLSSLFVGVQVGDHLPSFNVQEWICLDVKSCGRRLHSNKCLLSSVEIGPGSFGLDILFPFV